MRKLLNLNNFNLIGLDTNIFIYFFDQDSQFYEQAKNLIARIVQSRKATITTSIITLVELLSFSAQDELLWQLEDQLYQIPNLEIKDLNKETGQEVARLRRVYGLKLADSIQLATALNSQAEVFITNDRDLKKFKELPVLLITEI